MIDKHVRGPNHIENEPEKADEILDGFVSPGLFHSTFGRILEVYATSFWNSIRKVRA